MESGHYISEIKMAGQCTLLQMPMLAGQKPKKLNVLKYNKIGTKRSTIPWGIVKTPSIWPITLENMDS